MDNSSVIDKGDGPEQVSPSKKDPGCQKLREEVEAAFGRKVVNSGDCNELSQEIFKKTSFRINANTLRRFFGLVKTAYKPSSGTLHILARYCGYENFEELLQRRQRESSGDGGLTDVEFLDYLLALFRGVKVSNYNDETFLGLVKCTIPFLQQHPHLADKFQRAIAKTENGQNFYFEQFVDIDGLNGVFGDGIRYYLNEKKTTEAQIFGHSLLCLKGWLNNDVDFCRTHYEAVMKYRLNKSIHPFVCGRYFASQVYYADITGGSIEPILISAQQMHATLRPAKDNYRSFPGFEYALGRALLVTQNLDECLYYLDFALKKYTHRHSYVEEGFYQTLNLMKAAALLRQGGRKEAAEIMKQIKPSQFYFLTKKIDTIIYLYVKENLKGLSPQEKAQQQQLIDETGYVRLRQKT